MKLLIITQTVDKNDPILGFFHEWVKAFAGQVESIKLVGLEVGEYDLPSNVEVHSLGKEQYLRERCDLEEVSQSGRLTQDLNRYHTGETKFDIDKVYSDCKSRSDGKRSFLEEQIHSFKYIWRLNKLSWQLRKDYDVVFAHMNPEYVIAGGLLWKLLGKTITMWYAHGATGGRLRAATWLCKKIFTSTASGYRYDNKKRSIVGQGIDVDKFTPDLDGSSTDSGVVKLVTVGRITASKQLKTLLEAIYKLRQEGYRFLFKIYGAANTKEEEVYEAELKQLIKKWQIADQVEFMGPVTQAELVNQLHQSDIFISDGATGSLDKALLEAMACGLMVISSNESFGKIVPEPKIYTFENGNSDSLAECLVEYLRLDGKEQLRARSLLREEVVSNHSLAAFVEKIILGIKNS